MYSLITLLLCLFFINNLPNVFTQLDFKQPILSVLQGNFKNSGVNGAENQTNLAPNTTQQNELLGLKLSENKTDLGPETSNQNASMADGPANNTNLEPRSSQAENITDLILNPELTEKNLSVSVNSTNLGPETLNINISRRAESLVVPNVNVLNERSKGNVVPRTETPFVSWTREPPQKESINNSSVGPNANSSLANNTSDSNQNGTDLLKTGAYSTQEPPQKGLNNNSLGLNIQLPSNLIENGSGPNNEGSTSNSKVESRRFLVDSVTSKPNVSFTEEPPRNEFNNDNGNKYLQYSTSSDGPLGSSKPVENSRRSGGNDEKETEGDVIFKSRSVNLKQLQDKLISLGDQDGLKPVIVVGNVILIERVGTLNLNSNDFEKTGISKLKVSTDNVLEDDGEKNDESKNNRRAASMDNLPVGNTLFSSIGNLFPKP